MCGHVHVIRKDGKPAWKAVLRRYRNQKTRGTSGFGYVAIKDNQIVSYKRAETEHEIVNMLSKERAPEIMFHHRQPTGTPNVAELAHPFLIENAMLDHQYFVQHNGVIRNTGELKEAHEKLGFEYSSEMLKAYVTKQGEQHVTGTAWNDSESLAVETALALDGKKAKIETEGAAAVMGLQTKGKKVINRFFFRNVLNPLKFHEDNQMITVTSAGAGADVTSLIMYRIKHEGSGYEVFPGGVEPPLSYKQTTTPLYGLGPKKKENEYIESRVGRYKDRSGAWVEYPSGERGMGFLHGGLKRVNDFLGLAPYEDRDIEEYYGEPHERDYESMAADEENREGLTSQLLTAMDLNELWAEYDVSEGKRDELREEVDKLEIASKTIITLEQVNKLHKLRDELDDLEKWMDAVYDEITSKSSEEMPNQLSIDERLSK